MPETTDLILVRHGETDWNRELRFQGHVDVPLNTVGHSQAQRLAARLQADGVRADHLVCSDLLRTRQTAAPICAALLPKLALTAVTDPALREQHFGMAEGLCAPDIRQQHPTVWAQWLGFDADGGMPGGETARQFHARVMQALRRWAQQYTGQTLVVVTHGGVLDMVWRTAQGLALSGPRQSVIPNAALNRVRIRAADHHQIEIVQWADTAHLAGLPSQPVYDQTQLQPAQNPGQRP